ncbi:ThiF family adenylyltransferase [Streptomyces sp. NPDC052013]|uniref:ThiF family adenylyltransferase n=1 Tax=Streptomyces sp. NPDC052013 TaxID=3365679 RepID=UPI0037D1DF93
MGTVMRVRVTDHVLGTIVDRIGGPPPEAGGALLGPAGTDLVTHLVPDEEAAVTDVRYDTSTWLVEEVERLQRASAVRFKGIVHSHPAGLPAPSAQDHREYGRSLALNPHLGRCLVPVVTRYDGPPGAHELVSRGVRVSFFGAVSGPNGVEVLPMRPLVLPLVASLTRAEAREVGEPELLTVDGVPVLAVRARFPRLPSVAAVVFGVDFPATPPVLVSHGSPIALAWDPAAPAADRLALAVSGARPRRRTRALPLARREDPDGSGGRRARGLTRRDGGRLFARSAGLVAPELAERHVVLAGAGSVGAYVAECLVRSGVGRLTVIDPDRVAPENLGRCPYTVRDIGRPKVSALAARLRAVNPELAVRGERRTVHGLGARGWAELLRGTDLLVAATDDNRAQRLLDHLAYWTGVPAVFPGLYRRAAGGEVIMTYPGAACWGCATAGIRDLSADTSLARPTDYGTGRLVAEPGLVVDIQHVSAAAAKIALALLHPRRTGDDAGQVRIARFLDTARENGQSYVAFGTEPGYWLFGHVLGDAPGQHAFQSVWMTVERRPDCPVCGAEEYRSDPLSVPGQDVSPHRLRGLIRTGGRT